MEEEISTVNSLMVDGEDREIEDTVARARAEAAQEAAEAAQEAAGAGIVTDPVWVQHRNTYRGKYLGDEYTEEQKAMVAAGTFDDLYIGDYWTISGVDWLIADINYWLNTGDDAHTVTTPHLVIIPRICLYSAKMNDTNTTAGGYLGSKMYTSNLNSAKSLIYGAFGENNILNHREVLSNGVNGGAVSSAIWADSKVDLMNQIMVNGTMTFIGAFSSTNSTPMHNIIDSTQLAIFQLKHDTAIDIDISWWSRDVVSNNNFTILSKHGQAGVSGATSELGVRPSFGLIGSNN